MKTKQIGDLRARDINSTVGVIGEVVNCSPVQPTVISAKFECPSCGRVIQVLQIEKRLRKPKTCSCGRRGNFKLLSQELIDTQTIILKELENKFHSKRTIVIGLKDTMCDKKYQKLYAPGNKLKVRGKVREKQLPYSRGLSTNFDLIIEAKEIEKI